MKVNGYFQLGSNLHKEQLISYISRLTLDQTMPKVVKRELRDCKNLLEILLRSVNLLKCCITLSTIGLHDEKKKELVLCSGTCGYGANKTCPSPIEFTYSFSNECGNDAYILLLISKTDAQSCLKSPSDLPQWLKEKYDAQDDYVISQKDCKMSVIIKSGLKKLKVMYLCTYQIIYVITVKPT